VIRNSWGASWGEKGYYRIVRGAGACGLNTMVTTATKITFSGAVGATPEQEAKFHEFEVTFGKKYADEQERSRRLAIFVDNLLEIEMLKAADEGSATYSHLTPFADLSKEEFTQRNGFDLAGQDLSAAPLADQLDTSSLPDSFDWREQGAVNKVKDQKQCGSCWAFATVANIEGAGFVTNKKLLSLSEQELVDCDKGQDQGCQGGLPSNAYKFLISSKTGLEAEKDYPYKAKNGQCKATASEEQAFVSGWTSISKDEDQIAAAVTKYGPLAIGINAGPMQLYTGGIAHPSKQSCNPSKLDHGVAIVGFGVESGTKYWVIRNSWGASWGERGYYRIVRGAGACGLNTMVTTATKITLSSSSDALIV